MAVLMGALLSTAAHNPCRRVKHYWTGPDAALVFYQPAGNSTCMAIVSDATQYQSPEERDAALHALHRLLTAQNYPGSIKQAVKLGLRAVHKEVVKQAEMLPSTRKCDYPAGFALLNETNAAFTSKSLQEYQASKAATPAAYPACQGVQDYTNTTLLKYIELLVDGDTSRTKKPLNQRKSEMKKVFACHLLANAHNDKAVGMQVYTGFTAWAGGLRMSSWDLLCRLGLVASHDTVMSIAKAEADEKLAAFMSCFTGIKTFVVVQIDNLDFAQRCADTANASTGKIDRTMHVISSQATHRKEIDALPTTESADLKRRLDDAERVKEQLPRAGHKSLHLPAEVSAWHQFDKSVHHNLCKLCSGESGACHMQPSGPQGMDVCLGQSGESLWNAVLEDANTPCWYPAHGHEIITGPVCDGSAAKIGDVGAVLGHLYETFKGINASFADSGDRLMYGELCLHESGGGGGGGGGRVTGIAC